MLDIKKTLTKIIESIGSLTTAIGNLAPTAVTMTAQTNVSMSQYMNCYKVGRLCVINFNFQVTGSIASGNAMIAGLPAPIGDRALFSVTTANGTSKTANLRLSSSGTIDADGAISTTGWFSGSGVYVTAS